MLRIAACALLLCLVLPGHALRREDSAIDSMDDCQATKYAGTGTPPVYGGGSWFHEFHYQLCGSNFNATEETCDSFYVQD